LAEFPRSRMPLILTCCYVAIVLIFLVLAIVAGMTGQDEFGYSGIPLLYATFPLSLFLYKTHGFLFSIGIGCIVNAGVLYAFLKTIRHVWPSRKNP
jgi:hypothetical protein